ncbi:MAG: hypothetical protein Q9160_007196 [Pyrenula sp. 1 TL-2023]
MRSFMLALPLLLSVSTARSVYSSRSIHARQTADNLQSFTGNLGEAAPAISNSGDAKRPFDVAGDTFVNFAAAAQRTCDKQFNACANQANSGAAFSVSDCQTQKDACDAAQQSASVTSFSAGAGAGAGAEAAAGAGAGAASASGDSSSAAGAAGAASATGAAAASSTGTTGCATAKKVRRTRVKA